MGEEGGVWIGEERRGGEAGRERRGNRMGRRGKEKGQGKRRLVGDRDGRVLIPFSGLGRFWDKFLVSDSPNFILL